MNASNRLVRSALRRRADPAKAEPMRAYMKSSMPFLGVQAAGVGEVCRQVGPLGSDEVRALWDGARFREERYVAIGVSADIRDLALFEHMVVTGAWWDLVDPVAIHRIGPLLPDVRTAMLDWSRDEGLWKRRAAIICQNMRKSATDAELSHACIEANLDDRDFFIRKAIGWALRERAKLAPDDVRAFVAAHPELSPLSRREALRHL